MMLSAIPFISFSPIAWGYENEGRCERDGRKKTCLSIRVRGGVSRISTDGRMDARTRTCRLPHTGRCPIAVDLWRVTSPATGRDKFLIECRLLGEKNDRVGMPATQCSVKKKE